jgi:hypothetical protein
MCKDLKKLNVVNSLSSLTPFPRDVNYGALSVVDQSWFSTLVCDKLGALAYTLSFCLPMLLDKLSSTASKFSSTTNKLPKNYSIEFPSLLISILTFNFLILTKFAPNVHYAFILLSKCTNVVFKM